MTSYANINLTYDKQALLDMFNSAEKTVLPRRTKSILPSDFASTGILKSYLDKFTFIPQNVDSVEITQITKTTPPHITPNNSGYIIVPLSGSLVLKTYTFKFADPLSTNAYAIKSTDVLNTTMINDIEETLSDTISVQNPIAVDGSIVHSFVPSGDCVVLYLKIPQSVSWDEALTIMTQAGLVI